MRMTMATILEEMATMMTKRMKIMGVVLRVAWGLIPNIPTRRAEGAEPADLVIR